MIEQKDICPSRFPTEMQCSEKKTYCSETNVSLKPIHVAPLVHLPNWKSYYRPQSNITNGAYKVYAWINLKK